jgi:NAD(P)-dependent dehydrogenase (short-subunit alcohol dehydrogenase family)
MRLVVTGASGSLGSTFVNRCVHSGHRVAAAISDENLNAPEIVALPKGDLSDLNFARTSLGYAVEELGGVDALVHLAGGFTWTPTLTSSLDEWRQMMSSNVETALCSIQAIAPHLTSDGAIVCVGAASSQVAGAGMAAYATSKNGISRIVESLAIELKPRRIRINGVMPGIMDTEWNRTEMPDADWSQWTSTSAVSDAILFLCGKASRAINGAMIPVTNSI